MKLRLCLLLAATSILLAVSPARTARRPRYGGTLRWDMAASVDSPNFDASVSAPAGSEAVQLRNLIFSASGGGNSSKGTASGPFRVVEWQAGKRARLAANEDYAGGRAYIDSIEIEMGRSAKERLLDLELGKTDLAEIPAEEMRHAAERGVRLTHSQPDELIAIVFVKGRPLAEDIRAREALARVIDRVSIADFIVQKEGQAAGGLLPQWSSGIEFLFSAAANPAGAKELWSQIPGSPKISVGYDAGDALEQAIAERMAVNAHESGIAVGTIAMAGSATTSARVDARLLRLRMGSASPRETLAEFIGALGPVAGIREDVPPEKAPAEDIYACERSVLSTYRVVPVVWLPQVYGVSERVRNWKAPGPGESWGLTDVWLNDSEGRDASK